MTSSMLPSRARFRRLVLVLAGWGVSLAGWRVSAGGEQCPPLAWQWSRCAVRLLIVRLASAVVQPGTSTGVRAIPDSGADRGLARGCSTDADHGGVRVSGIGDNLLPVAIDHQVGGLQRGLADEHLA